MTPGQREPRCTLEAGPMHEARDPTRSGCHGPTVTDGIGPVVVTGTSGLIGTAVCQSLRHSGHEVRRLVRREPERDDEYRWAPEADFIDTTVFSGARSVVHLAGAPVATRWTKTMKNRIFRSRVEGTRQIHSAASQVHSVRTLVCASAVGFYGFDPARPAASESTESGDGFSQKYAERGKRPLAPRYQAAAMHGSRSHASAWSLMGTAACSRTCLLSREDSEESQSPARGSSGSHGSH